MAIAQNKLNEIVKDIVKHEMTLRLHSGDPTTEGTENIIKGSERTIKVADWTEVSNGCATYLPEIDYGIMNKEHLNVGYSLFRGNLFVAYQVFRGRNRQGWLDIHSGSTFKIETGTIQIIAVS